MHTCRVHDIKYTDLHEHSDVKPGQRYICPKASRYVIDCGDEANNVPDEVRAHQGPAIALSTSAQENACALHSIFGVPSSTGQLTAPNARHLALQLMQA